jgi:hypothetical protein
MVVPSSLNEGNIHVEEQHLIPNPLALVTTMSDTPTAPNNIVLYWYPASPYGRRVTWYLALRKIKYAECVRSNPTPNKKAKNTHKN